jgi:hypothetical protein
MTQIIPVSQLVVEVFSSQWYKFKQKLPQDLQRDFDQLMNYAKRHPIPGTEAIPFQQIVISILIEQEKELDRLRKKLIPHSKKKCPRCSAERNKEDFIGALCPDCREYLLFPLPNKKLTDEGGKI